MKRIWLKVALLFLCFIASSAKSFAAPRDLHEAAVIVPGRSVGRIHLGMSRQSLRKMLGKPMSSEGTKHDEWWELVDDLPPQESGAPFISVDYVGGRATQIAFRLQGAMTSDNFLIDNTLSQIRRRFKGISPSAPRDVVDVKQIVYSSKQQGIGFSFISESGKIANSQQPECFIVFRPGHRVVPSWN